MPLIIIERDFVICRQYRGGISYRGTDRNVTFVFRVLQNRGLTDSKEIFTSIAVGIKSGFVLGVESLGKCQRQLSKRITRLVQILRTECQNAAQRPGIQ